MEELTTFLSSDIGRILCYVLIFVGITDILIARLVFGNILKKTEQLISPAMSPEQRKPLDKKIEGMKLVMKVVTVSGFAFIAVAVFGLTR